MSSHPGQTDPGDQDRPESLSPDFIELFRLKILLEERYPRSKTVLINQNSSGLLGLLAAGELDL